MYSLLIFLLPSVLGIKIIDTLSKKEKIKDFIIYYLLFIVGIIFKFYLYGSNNYFK